MTLTVSSPSGQFIDFQAWQPLRRDLRLSSSNLHSVQKPRGVAGRLLRRVLMLRSEAARMLP